MHADEDATLLLIIRSWMTCDTLKEFTSLWAVFDNVFHWGTESVSDSVCRKMFEDIRRGADGSFRRFLAKFAALLSEPWIKRVDLETAFVALQCLFNAAMRIAPLFPSEEPDFARSVLKNEDLWKAIFVCMVRSPHDVTASVIHSSTVMKPNDIHSSVMGAIITFNRSVFVRWPNEHPLFVRILVKAGAFEALDNLALLCKSRGDGDVFCKLFVKLLVFIRMSISNLHLVKSVSA